MTETRRDELLLQIWKKLGEIEVKLDNDFREIHGNGKPGILEKMENITQRVNTLENKEKDRQSNHSTIAAVIAFIVNGAIAIYAAIKNHI